MSFTLYISDSYDPYFNLAIENQLLMSIDEHQKILFLYQNNPCLVFGRFQNPWMESDLYSAKKKGISIVRRQSGGGTVFHDLGNINFSFIHPSTDYKKDENNKVIAEVLSSFGIHSLISKRSDLLVEYNGVKKISGSAFKQKKDRSFHHGTLLIDSNLDNLRSYLQSPWEIIESRSIKSNPHSVVNLSEINSDITVQSCIDRFQSLFGTAKNLPVLKDEIYLNFLKSEDWQIGETPLFKIKISGKKSCLELELKKGIIKSIGDKTEENSAYRSLLGKNILQIESDIKQILKNTDDLDLLEKLKEFSLLF